MKSKRADVYTMQTQNCVLSDIYQPVINLTKDRQKLQIKYRYHVFHTRMPTPN